jgi:hypothetical protein
MPINVKRFVLINSGQIGGVSTVVPAPGPEIPTPPAPEFAFALLAESGKVILSRTRKLFTGRA